MASPIHKYFSADRPIDSRSDDKLGRRRFSESLARAVQGWAQRDSLVIALYGAWGIGKSSIKNMMLDTLRESAPIPATIVEFNPWQFANRDRLLQSFFDQIAIVLGKTSDADRQKVLTTWRKYASYLTLGRTVGDLIHKPLGILLGLFAGASLAGHALIPPHIAFFLDLLLVGLAAVIAFSSKAADAVTEFLKSRVDNSQTVEEIKTELAQALRKSKQPLLIILDDLDRLTPTETFEMFQIVKANADLPNVIYLLLCDRTVITRHLGQLLGESGDEFMSKIVQVGFDVPAIERSRLLKVLTSGLDEILESDPILVKQFDQRRWANLFLGGIDTYFKNLRDVNRYLGTLAFHISLLRGSQSFDVNIVDLIAIETLRLFEPALYRRLSESKELLVPKFRLERREPEKKAILSILEAVPESRREAATQIVKELFPPTQWAFGGSHYAADFNEQWDRELRICSSECFDRYFLLALPSGDLSEDVISGLLAASDDRATLVAEFSRLFELGQIEKSLERLESHKQRIRPTTPFITALFDVGDLLSNESSGFFDMSPLMHLVRIAYWSLKQEKDQTARGGMVLQALRDTTGVAAPAQFVSIESQSAEKAAEGDSRELTFTPEQLNEAKALVSAKIAALAERGDLLSTPNPIYLLYRWRDWAGEDGPKAFVAKAIENPQTAIQLLRDFLLKSTTHGVGDKAGRVNYYVDLKTIDPFIDPEQLAKALSAVTDDQLDERARTALTKLRLALRRRREGKHEGDAFMREDDED